MDLDRPTCTLAEKSRGGEGGKPMPLFNGKDLAGWKMSDTGSKVAWTVENGALMGPGHGPELISDAKFKDFKLHVEFNCGRGRRVTFLPCLTNGGHPSR